MKTKKEKLEQNNLSSKKKTGLQIKTIKETKYLEIGAEKKHDAEKTFLRNKNFISVAKKLFLRNKYFISVAKKLFP